jgi:hypothetical protein
MRASSPTHTTRRPPDDPVRGALFAANNQPVTRTRPGRRRLGWPRRGTAKTQPAGTRRRPAGTWTVANVSRTAQPANSGLADRPTSFGVSVVAVVVVAWTWAGPASGQGPGLVLSTPAGAALLWHVAGTHPWSDPYRPVFPGVSTCTKRSSSASHRLGTCSNPAFSVARGTGRLSRRLMILEKSSLDGTKSKITTGPGH